MLRRALIVLLLLLVEFGFAGDFENAVKAWNKQDYQTAFRFYKKACNSGNVQGCISLGGLYVVGTGVKQDSFKAVELYQKACKAGAAGGCTQLGMMYLTGNGIRQSDELALEYIGKGCDMKDADGCKSYAALKNR